MKILLVSIILEGTDSYPSVQLKLHQKIFGEDQDTVCVEKPEADKKNPIYTDRFLDKLSKKNMSDYDFVIGVGDTFISNISKTGKITRDTFAEVKKAIIEFDNKPRLKSAHVDYMFYHLDIPSLNPRCFYVGQGLNPDYLYYEEKSDNQVVFFVDHHMPKRRDITQKILTALESVYDKYGDKIKILHHANQGIRENYFIEEDLDLPTYVKYDYGHMCQIYRTVDVAVPTHRETQGVLAAEVGMCGGISLIQPWMYPQPTLAKVPHILYKNWDINWDHLLDTVLDKKVKQNSIEHTYRFYSIEGYSKRLYDTLEKIKCKTK